jgi:hypothetical protein
VKEYTKRDLLVFEGFGVRTFVQGRFDHQQNPGSATGAYMVDRQANLLHELLRKQFL